MQGQTNSPRTDGQNATRTWDKLKKKLTAYLQMYLPSGWKLPAGGKSASAARFALRTLGVAVYAYFISRAPLPMQVYPFGTALLCAVSGNAPYVYLGVLFAALSTNGGMEMLLSSTALLVLRVGTAFLNAQREGKLRLFSESLPTRLIGGAAVGFFFGLFRVAMSGFLYYDIFASILNVLTIVLFGWQFYGIGRKTVRNSLYCEASLNALLAVFVYALHTVWGSEIAIPAAFVITLFVSHGGGMLRGCFTGLLCGMGCGLSMSPVLALAGIVSGFLWQINRSVAVTASALCAALLGGYAQGWEALRSLAPEFLIPAMIFLPLVQFGLLPKIRILQHATPACMGGNVNAERRAEKTATQLQALSTALESLSDVFYNLSDRLRKPGIYQIRRQCETEMESHCASCSMHRRCREQNQSKIAQATDRLARAMQSKETVSMEDLPDWMRISCPRSALMVSGLNLSVADLRETMRRHDKTGIVAMDYESMAKLVEHAASDDPDIVYDEECSDKVLHAAQYMDFHIDTAAVYGSRRRTLICSGTDLGAFRLSAEELSERMGNLCDTRFGAPEFTFDQQEGGDEYVTMTLQSCRRFGVESASAGKAEPGQSVSGDHLITFENDDDYFYTLLSDGMGTGREAALTSRICGVFMEKMLRASAKKDIALEMLNGVIRTKGMECFATVDLLEIDLMTGHAGFIKGGAAPSYVIRNKNLFKIASNTMPIGITREMNAEEITFALQEGDIIVMASDGVAQSFEDGIWLVNMLSEEMDENLSNMADKILYAAKKHNRRADDMTVGLLRITNAA